MTFLNKKLNMEHFKEFIKKREAYFSNKISYNDEFGYFDSKKLLFDFLSSGLNYQAGKIAAELNAWNEFGRFILPGDVYETKINEMKLLYLRQKYIEELNRKTSAETEFVHVDFNEEEFDNEVERYEIPKNLDFRIFWTNKIKKFTKEEIQDDILYHACVASSDIIDKYITLYINREFEPINENDRVFTTGTFIDIMGIEEDDPEYKNFIYGKIENNIDKILSYPTVEFRKYK